MSALSPIAAFLAPGLPTPRGGRAWAAPVPRPAGARWVRRVATLTASARAAWRRQRSRARIAGLDTHLLADIGVSHAEAEHEANKPFWRA